MLKEILRRVLAEPITQEEALYLLKKIQTIDEFLELAKVASKIRDNTVGGSFQV